MGFGSPAAPTPPAAPPAPPTLASDGVTQAAANQGAAGSAAAGMGDAGTLLTSPQGLLKPAITANKTLLGN